MSTDPAGTVPESSSIQSGPANSGAGFSAPAGMRGVFAADATITLPPPVVAECRLANPERTARALRRLDWFFVGANLLLAFLLGSFLARNTDIWMHIAGGRALLQGVYHFGVDPFSSTMNGTYWVNHAWLFDVAAFGVFQVFGGAGLVILKALVLAVLAGVMIRLGNKDGSVWIAAVCTGLALLAMSARLVLQPVCVSYLFLALTLWFLERPNRRTGSSSRGEDRGILAALRNYWPLPLLFAFWVNLDEWFILGPITVGLYVLGRGLQALFTPAKGELTPRRGETIGLIVVFAVGLAACLLNPHHVYAFVLPAQLGLTESADFLRQDPGIRGLFVSPFDPVYLRSLLAGVQVAGWLYFLLVVLGLFSFTVNRSVGNWWRMVIWSAFFLLSAFQARMIPFFAVVAGPITALNIQECLASYFGSASSSEAPARAWSFYGRCLTAFVLFALVVLAWPGWLQPHPHERRTWAVQPDPSLERAAAQIADWRKDGKLGPDAFGFNVSPETANYFAWACPEEKGFVDSRLRVPADAAADYVALRQALLAPPGQVDESTGGADKPAKDWREILRSRRINHIILHDSDLRRISAALRRLLASPEEWSLLYLDGRTAVFGWADPALQKQTDAFAGMHLDINRRGFYPSSEEQAPRESSGPVAKPWQWWDAFVRPPAFRSLDADAAAACLIEFEAQVPRSLKAKRKRWENSIAASACGLSAAQGFTAPNLALTLRLSAAGAASDGRGAPRKEPLRPSEVDVAAGFFWRSVFAQTDDQAMALPLAAARAARRALVANPGDVDAHQWLGQAYLTLRDVTVDPKRPEVFPPLSMLRHVQIVAVLEEALRLNPDLEAVHQALANVYGERHYMDMALEHRRAEQRLTLRTGPRPRESADEFAQRTSQLDKVVRDLEEAVQNRQNELLIRSRSAGGDPLGRAHLAVDLGLYKQALDDVLLKSDVLMFGGAGARLEISLFLMLGRMSDAREKLEDSSVLENKARLGYFELPTLDSAGRPRTYRFPAYEWLIACLAAASGDYDRSSDALNAIRDHLHAESVQTMPRIRKELALAIASEIGVRTDLSGFVGRFLMYDRREQLTRMVTQNFFLEEEQADLHVMSGLIALEQGASGDARRHFEQAIAVVDEGPEPGTNFGGRYFAVAMLNRLRAARDEMNSGR